MISIGIESINLFGGSAFVDVTELAKYRKLDKVRFKNLLMEEKTVALPFEDPITYGVNAAMPLINELSKEEKDRIELLITCTESGIDFGKSISSYIHHYLELNRNCRQFEIKQACYSATAGLQMAVSFILSQVSSGAKALVIASDISRFMKVDGKDVTTSDWSFAEPSSGAGAVAMLISEKPHVFRVDVGANGYYGYEVMDTCRPVSDSEIGDSDLSLMSYLDCYEKAYLEYQKRVPGTDYKSTFQYLAFHTPFGGMIKGAHRTMLRKQIRASSLEIEDDFTSRVALGLAYCQRVGNIMGGTLYMALLGIIECGDFTSNKRIGCFSYGSGCCSEFFSGVVTKEGQRRVQLMETMDHLNNRYRLSMKEYEALLHDSTLIKFGTRNIILDDENFSTWFKMINGKKRLVLKEIKDFHRKYQWE